MGDKKGLGRGVDLSPALTRSIISSVNFRCGDEGEREGEEGDGLSGVPGTGEGRGPWSWSLVLLRELEANRDPSSCLRHLSFLRLFPGGGRWSSSSRFLICVNLCKCVNLLGVISWSKERGVLLVLICIIFIYYYINVSESILIIRNYYHSFIINRNTVESYYIIGIIFFFFFFLPPVPFGSIAIRIIV